MSHGAKDKTTGKNSLKKPVKTDVKNYFSLNNYSYRTYFLFFLVSIILYTCFKGTQNSASSTTEIQELIKGLQNKFPGQSTLTFKIFQAALKRVVAPKPTAPAIISLLVDKGAYSTAINFCRHLAETLAPSKNVFIDGSVFRYKDYNEIKLEIDKEIKSKVDNSTLHVVLVDKFEDIPVDASMIFHSYCDHENAGFKHMVYMFVLSLEDILPADADQKHLDRKAIQYLKKTWHNAESDFIDSLITRITVNVVNIK